MEWVLIYTVLAVAPTGSLGFDHPVAITSGEAPFAQQVHCEEGLNKMKARFEKSNIKIEGLCLYMGAPVRR